LKSKESKAVQKSLTKRRVAFEALDPVLILMKLMKKGDTANVSLVRIPELDLEAMFFGDEESIVSELERVEFPYEVEVWNKKFALVCTEMCEG